MKAPFNYKTFEMKSNAEKRKQAKIKKILINVFK